MSKVRTVCCLFALSAICSMARLMYKHATRIYVSFSGLFKQGLQTASGKEWESRGKFQWCSMFQGLMDGITRYMTHSEEESSSARSASSSDPGTRESSQGGNTKKVQMQADCAWSNSEVMPLAAV